MSKKNEKTSEEAKVQQEVVGEIPAVFNVDESEATASDGLDKTIEEVDFEEPTDSAEATEATDNEDKPKVEDSEVVEVEQKVIALVILGNLHAVIDILNGYKWKSLNCQKIWDVCVSLNSERKHISSASVQMTLNVQKESVDVSVIMANIPSTNLLIPFANKLVELQSK